MSNPNRNECSYSEKPNSSDTISRQAAIDALEKAMCEDGFRSSTGLIHKTTAYEIILHLPSVQPKQRYTEEELSVFAHGISLSLLSKRSAQHWQYDEDTATEIEFLERLYDKVSADTKGGQDG